jgi:hypothetical protein
MEGNQMIQENLETPSVVTNKLEVLAQEVVRYRKIHGGQRLPNLIWDEAVGLCNELSFRVVAEGISVSEKSLRIKWKKKKNSMSPRGAFLQLPSLSSVGHSCVANREITIERADGLQIRIMDLNSHGLKLSDFMAQLTSGILQ